MGELEKSMKFEWRRKDPTYTGKPYVMDRFGCSATLVGHFIWVMGGYQYKRDVSLLDLNKQVWTKLSLTGKVYQLQLHTANLVNDSILVLGAEQHVQGYITGNSVRDVIKVDCVMLEAEELPTYNDLGRPEFRQAHTADVFEREQLLVVFGGSPLAASASDQLYILDLNLRAWSRPNSKGKPPSSRSRHSSFMVGSRLFIYSGDDEEFEQRADADLFTVDIKRKETLIWQQVELTGNPRYKRIGAGVKYVGNGRVIIFGGYSVAKSTKDLFVIQDVLSNQPTCYEVGPQPIVKFSYSGEVPQAREAPRMILTRGKLIVIGGSGRDKSSYFELVPISKRR